MPTEAMEAATPIVDSKSAILVNNLTEYYGDLLAVDHVSFTVHQGEVFCAWQLIWDRAVQLGRVDQLLEIQPPKDWSTSRDGGPRKIVCEDLLLTRNEQKI